MSPAICDPVRMSPYPTATDSDTTFHFQTLAIVPTNASTAATNLLEGTSLPSALLYAAPADVVPSLSATPPVISSLDT